MEGGGGEEVDFLQEGAGGFLIKGRGEGRGRARRGRGRGREREGEGNN